MNTKDYFKDIYKDFFGVEKDLEDKTLELNKNERSSQEEMTDLFQKIDCLYLTNESKELLKKMIEYMRKYHEKLENNYIPFSVILEVNNDEIKKTVEDILYEAANYFNYIKGEYRKDISFYKLESNLNFSDISFLTLSNVKGINLEEEKSIRKFFYELEELLKKDSKLLTILSGTKEEIDTIFLGRESLRKEYFEFTLTGISPDIQDIYQYILKQIEVSDDLKIKLLDYIGKTYDKDKNYIKYQNDLIKYISFHKSIPPLEIRKNIDEIFEELNELVGLEKVKKVLYELVDVMNLKEKTKNNLKIKDLNLHMVFLGNPGTGKTTIARIIANILYELGYIKENKLVETSVKDLVAEYVGQTAPKTMSVIEKSLNGVLFIDEAYSLAVGNNNSYNAEAIATLIQAMENYRDKLVVIFAGYTKEMQDFLNSNSGIVSRIGYTLEFDDYTTDELVQIFLSFMTKSGFIVEDEAIDYLKKIINENRNMKNFGNARFIRNIYEKTIIKHASNVKDKKQKKLLKTITKKDISVENLILDK